jgi:hypothetical protein
MEIPLRRREFSRIIENVLKGFRNFHYEEENVRECFGKFYGKDEKC